MDHFVLVKVVLCLYNCVAFGERECRTIYIPRFNSHATTYSLIHSCTPLSSTPPHPSVIVVVDYLQLLLISM